MKGEAESSNDFVKAAFQNIDVEVASHSDRTQHAVRSASLIKLLLLHQKAALHERRRKNADLFRGAFRSSGERSPLLPSLGVAAHAEILLWTDFHRAFYGGPAGSIGPKLS